MKLPKFSSKVFLAPMAGISDTAFRLICREQGAGLVFTELMSVHAIVAKEREIEKFIPVSKKERPVAVQLFGSNVEMLRKAARIVEPYFEIIDYNLGCPAPHITEQMAGAALLQKSELTTKIFSTLVGSVNKPVSVKMRTGVGRADRYKAIAKIAEDCGVSMITLHARTLKQGYSGNADWNCIKELKELVNVPVVGNGDINCPEDALRMFSSTGCDYVMIGRAAMNNPFIFKQVNDYLKDKEYKKVSWDDKRKLFFKYMKLAQKYEVKFANIRMQAMNFSTGIMGARELRVKMGRCKDEEELKGVLERS